MVLRIRQYRRWSHEKAPFVSRLGVQDGADATENIREFGKGRNSFIRRIPDRPKLGRLVTLYQAFGGFAVPAIREMPLDSATVCE